MDIFSSQVGLEGDFLLDHKKGEGRFWESTPLKTNMEAKMKIWKMVFLFKGVIFRFHVSFLGGKNMFASKGWLFF